MRITENNKKNVFVTQICNLIIKKASYFINLNNRFSLVLSGGNTPKDVFIELSKKKYLNQINWKKVHFFWLDDRCVHLKSEHSNYRLAHELLISKMNEIGSINYINGDLSPVDSLKDYREKIFNYFGKDKISFDFILLGMGLDGHVASIFPSSNEFSNKHNIVVKTKKKHNNYKRISFTLKTINNAKFNLLIVNDQHKWLILKNKDKDLPINNIKIDEIIYLNEK